MWRSIKKIINSHDSFLITTHINPDGDGVGAAVALMELLLFLNKKVRFVYDSIISEKFLFLDFHSFFHSYSDESDYSDVEVFIVLDVHEKDRIGKVSKIADNKNVISICIDHHNAVSCFTDYSLIDPKASSVGTMVYTLFKELGYDLNLNAAKAIYTSIICDTGRFSYSSTSLKAIKIAEECIKVGVNPDDMHSKIFQKLTWPQVFLFSHSLNSLKRFFNNKLLLLEVDDDLSMATNDFDYIHEFTKLIDGVECTLILVKLNDGFVRISARAKNDIALDEIMKQFGGGGHRKAAGALLKGSFDEIKNVLMENMKNIFDDI